MSDILCHICHIYVVESLLPLERLNTIINLKCSSGLSDGFSKGDLLNYLNSEAWEIRYFSRPEGPNKSQLLLHIETWTYQRSSKFDTFIRLLSLDALCITGRSSHIGWSGVLTLHVVCAAGHLHGNHQLIQAWTEPKSSAAYSQFSWVMLDQKPSWRGLPSIHLAVRTQGTQGERHPKDTQSPK